MKNQIIPKTNLIFPEEFKFDLYNAKGTITQPLLHYHDCLELNYVISGQGINYIEDKKYIMNQGDLYLINNFEHHIAVSDGSLKMKVLVFDPIYFWQGDKDNYDYLIPFYRKRIHFSNKININEFQMERVSLLFDELEQEWLQRENGYRLFIQAKLMELLAVIYRHLYSSHQIENDENRQNSYDRIRPSIEYINEHYSETLNLENLSAKSFMSRTYFSSFFRQVMGMTITEYIELVRINKVCVFIRTSDASIISICYQCGFKNVSSFNASFKKVCRITPTKYRKQLFPN